MEEDDVEASEKAVEEEKVAEAEEATEARVFLVLLWDA